MVLYKVQHGPSGRLFALKTVALRGSSEELRREVMDGMYNVNEVHQRVVLCCIVNTHTHCLSLVDVHSFTLSISCQCTARS